MPLPNEIYRMNRVPSIRGEWKKTLAFEYDDFDSFLHLKVVKTVTCRWRNDGVCFYTECKRYPDNEKFSEAHKSNDIARWEMFLNQGTDVPPAPEKEFDRSFVWNKISNAGRLIDTGYTVDPEVEAEVLSNPLVKKLAELESKNASS